MIPAQAVEAAARAVPCLWRPPRAEHPTHRFCEDCRDQARAALEAAAPYMQAGAWQEGYLCSYDQERGGHGVGPIPVPEHLADDLMQWNPYRINNEKG